MAEAEHRPILGSLDDIPKRRVWRVALKAKELQAAGFDPEVIGGGWPVIEKLLRAKGLPSYYLDDRTPFRMQEHEDGLLLEFD